MVLVREKSGQFSRTSGAGEDHAPSRTPAGIPSGQATTDFCCGRIDALKVSRGGTAIGSENRPRPLSRLGDPFAPFWPHDPFARSSNLIQVSTRLECFETLCCTRASQRVG
jgi:hypothetical protein